MLTSEWHVRCLMILIGIVYYLRKISDTAATNWHRKLMDVIFIRIPQQTLKGRKNVPWLTKNIIRHMRKRNAAFHATKRSDRPEVATKYKKLRNKVVKMLREAKNLYLNRLNVGNKKQFWKAVKVLNKQQSMIPTLHHQETTAKTNYEKASMLNEYFSTCFNASVPPLSQLDEESQTHVEFGSTYSEDLLCTTEEVLSYIQILDATKASGPDGISIRMLKHTATVLKKNGKVRDYKLTINQAAPTETYPLPLVEELLTTTCPAENTVDTG